MTLDDHIAAYLQTYHCGAKNVVTSREVEAAFRIRGPDLRRRIKQFHGKGIPICSTDRGYFYAATGEEIEQTVSQLQSCIAKLAYAERGLREALAQRRDSGQITLPLGGEND